MEFPTVPEDCRPLYLYHAEISSMIAVQAMQAGYTLIDVRTMPNKTDEDRRACIKGWLEGIRSGTIIPDPKRLKFMELEAKVLGMIGGKGLASETRDDEAVNLLLSEGDGH